MDKLCLRYKNCDDERLCRDITYCLSLLPFKTEKSYHKLLGYMPLYQDKLHEETVYKLFTEIIAKVSIVGIGIFMKALRSGLAVYPFLSE